MKVLRLALFCPLFAAMCWAQGTRTWEQTKYDEFEKGTSHGVAVRSDGTLTLAPAFSALYTSPSTYLWGLAADVQRHQPEGVAPPVLRIDRDQGLAQSE